MEVTGSIKELWLDFELFLLKRVGVTKSQVLSGVFDHRKGEGISRVWGCEDLVPDFNHIRWDRLPCGFTKGADFYNIWSNQLSFETTHKNRIGFVSGCRT